MNRRTALTAIASAIVLPTAGAATTGRMLVTKSPSCGCCTAWVTHMRKAGFLVDTRDVSQDALYAQGRTAHLWSESVMDDRRNRSISKGDAWCCGRKEPINGAGATRGQ